MRPERLRSENNRQDPGVPPDLDQLWRDFNQKLNKWLGRRPRGSAPSGGHPPRLLWALLPLLLLAWLGTGWRSVAPGEQATLSLLGQRRAIVGPGQRWWWPAPLGAVQRYDLQLPHQVDVGAGDDLLLSGDRQLLDLRLRLQLRIVDLRAYLDTATAPDAMVAAVAQSQLRAVVAARPAAALLASDHAGVAADLQRQLQVWLGSAGLGLRLDQVSVVQAQPPAEVLAAADQAEAQLQQARQQLQQQQHQAQAPAGGDRQQAQALLQQARADSAAMVEQARVDAQRFTALLPSYRRAPAATLDALQREMRDQVLRGADRVVVDASAARGAIRIDLPAPASAPAHRVQPDAAPAADDHQLTRSRER